MRIAQIYCDSTRIYFKALVIGVPTILLAYPSRGNKDYRLIQNIDDTYHPQENDIVGFI